jgi:DMSO/TMAO reductase YedYZ molybdopterin-dependent catalytic subunit
MRCRLVACCLLWIAWSAYAAQPAADPAGSQSIKLILDGKPGDLLDRAAMAALPRVTVTAAVQGEKSSVWQGVALEDIVRRTCVASDAALWGRAMARFVRVTGADGYQVVFGAAELHPEFGNVQVILADTRDGQPLSQGGPYRLVVPGDKRPDRWVQHVGSIEVQDAWAP